MKLLRIGASSLVIICALTAVTPAAAAAETSTVTGSGNYQPWGIGDWVRDAYCKISKSC